MGTLIGLNEWKLFKKIQPVKLFLLRYVLTSVTPSYRDYLNCFGMPGFVVSLIMGAGENIKVQDHSNGSITIETITGAFFDIGNLFCCCN